MVFLSFVTTINEMVYPKIAQRSEQLTCNQFGNNGMGIELLLFFFKEHIHSGDAFT